LIVGVPNFGHWYPRGRVALGRFDYDRRGILDRGHVRFFTRRTAERVFEDAGFTSRHVEPVGLPVDVLAQRSTGSSSPNNFGRRMLQRLDRAGIALSPTLFAYQFLFELEPTPPAS
jgi:hypothetical protein